MHRHGISIQHLKQKRSTKYWTFSLLLVTKRVHKRTLPYANGRSFCSTDCALLVAPPYRVWFTKVLLLTTRALQAIRKDFLVITSYTHVSDQHRLSNAEMLCSHVRLLSVFSQKISDHWRRPTKTYSASFRSTECTLLVALLHGILFKKAVLWTTGPFQTRSTELLIIASYTCPCIWHQQGVCNAKVLCIAVCFLSLFREQIFVYIWTAVWTYSKSFSCAESPFLVALLNRL